MEEFYIRLTCPSLFHSEETWDSDYYKSDLNRASPEYTVTN